jgi:hypothetical protein
MSSSHEVTAERAPGAFDVDQYIAQRNADPDFLLIELGHRVSPIAFQQPVGFNGKRAYIGIEAWLRDIYGIEQKHVASLTDTHRGDQNIFFMPLFVNDGNDGRFHRTSDEYDPRISLPTGVASEIFMGNVFGDPHIHGGSDRTENLLAEVARLAKLGGTVVIRETITPEYTHLAKRLLEINGLRKAYEVGPGNKETWEKLEAIFAGHHGQHDPLPSSFYMFLSRIANPLTVV